MQENCPVSAGVKKIYGLACRWRQCLASGADLAIRLYVADIFWKSALAKLANWDSTLYLFAEEYKVPLLPPHLAAYLGTGVEIIGSALLAFGLLTPVAALALLFQVAVIDLTYTHAEEHIYWALLLLVPLFHGPGKISLDYLIYRRCRTAND